MDQLIELLLSSGLSLSLFTDDLLELDRSMPKSDFFALLMLDRRGQATMSELAADLGAPLSTVTGIVGRLAKKNLVIRERDAFDRRAIIVRLSPEGKHLASKSTGQLSSLFTRVQQILTPEEVELLFQLAQKIMTALSRSRADQSTETPKVRKIIIED